MNGSVKWDVYICMYVCMYSDTCRKTILPVQNNGHALFFFPFSSREVPYGFSRLLNLKSTEKRDAYVSHSVSFLLKYICLPSFFLFWVFACVREEYASFMK